MPISQDRKTYISPATESANRTSSKKRTLIILGSIVVGYFAGAIAAMAATVIFIVTGGLGWAGISGTNEDLYNFLVNVIGFVVAVTVAYITYRAWMKHLINRDRRN